MPKTNLQPKDLFELRNTSDVFNRLVILGMLRILNRRLVYDNIWDKDTVQEVTVPTFFDFSGGTLSSERFIQDNYTFFTSDECTEIGLKKIDGNFDFYPQGRLQLNSANIQSGNITNRFSMGQYQKIVNGRLQSFTSYLYSIPLEFAFTLEIRAENMTTAFKIDQNVREFFYKNHTFRFNYKGTPIHARAGFPENGIQGAGTNYTMGGQQQENYIKLSYGIHVGTYQPCWDKFNERPADNVIKDTAYGIYVNNKHEGDEVTGFGQKDKMIRWKTAFDEQTLCCGMEKKLEWEWICSDNDLLSIDIYYMIEGSDEKHYICKNEENHEFYFWNIGVDNAGNFDAASGFVTNPTIDVTFPNSDVCTVLTQPEIILYPDAKSRTVEPQNVYVKSKGFFNTYEPDETIDALIEYEDNKGRIVSVDATATLKNYMLDSDGIPLDFDCIVYEGELDAKKIRLYIQEANNPEVSAETDWVYIV